MKRDGTRADIRFSLSGETDESTYIVPVGGVNSVDYCAAEVCGISCSNAGYTVFRGSVKGTDYPLYSTVSPSLPFPCVTVCHHISTGL